MLRIFLGFILVGCMFPLKTYARLITATISGMVKDAKSKAALPFVSVVCKKASDTTFVTGTVTSETGLFTMSNINSGNYILEVSRVGFETKAINIYVGSLSSFFRCGNNRIAGKY